MSRPAHQRAAARPQSGFNSPEPVLMAQSATTETTTRREWIEIATALLAVAAAFFVAPAMGIDLPQEATAFAGAGAVYLLGDGATDLARKSMRSDSRSTGRQH